MSDQEEQSLITDEHRALVGVKSEPYTVTVQEIDSARMRDLLGDTDPRWAEGTGTAPPYALASFGGRPSRNMPFILPNGLLTQQEWRFNRMFNVGEELQAVAYVSDIRERLGGRYGHSILITSAVDYLDKDGNVVASALSMLTQFDPARAVKEGGE
ncbi:MAG: hypothetical protein ACKVVT_12935 [Dehalococcoidia bacterium]